MTTTRRKPFRSQWTPRQPEPKPEPPDSAHQKALRLPRPGPGIVVPVPLHLWIAYKGIYHLEPTGIQEPKTPRRDGPGEAILLVKHEREEDK